MLAELLANLRGLLGGNDYSLLNPLLLSIMVLSVYIIWLMIRRT